jgi:hypothetical protein
VDGLEVRFFSNDHMPPHLHVSKRGEWHIKVYILETTARVLSYDTVFVRRSIPRGVRRHLARRVALHRATLLREWEAKVQGDH